MQTLPECCSTVLACNRHRAENYYILWFCRNITAITAIIWNFTMTLTVTLTRYFRFLPRHCRNIIKYFCLPRCRVFCLFDRRTHLFLHCVHCVLGWLKRLLRLHSIASWKNWTVLNFSTIEQYDTHYFYQMIDLAINHSLAYRAFSVSRAACHRRAKFSIRTASRGVVVDYWAHVTHVTQ
jgi:hypothetical protein